MKKEKIIINNIYQYLNNYLSRGNLTPEKVVEIYCMLNNKYGYVEYDKDGKNPVAVIQDRSEYGKRRK